MGLTQLVKKTEGTPVAEAWDLRVVLAYGMFKLEL